MPHLGTSDQIPEGVSFPEFALRCACMFFHDTAVVKGGALGVQIPELKADSSHRTKLAEAKAKLKMLKAMSGRERLRWAAKEATEAFEVEQIRHHESLTRQAEAKKKYEAMLAQVEAWKPPTSRHRRLKEIMLEHINDDMKFDFVPVPAPKRKTAKQFLAAEMAKLKDDVARYSEQFEHYRARARKGNRWIGDLTKSLVAFQKAGKGAATQ